MSYAIAFVTPSANVASWLTSPALWEQPYAKSLKDLGDGLVSFNTKGVIKILPPEAPRCGNLIISIDGKFSTVEELFEACKFLTRRLEIKIEAIVDHTDTTASFNHTVHLSFGFHRAVTTFVMDIFDFWRETTKHIYHDGQLCSAPGFWPAKSHFKVYSDAAIMFEEAVDYIDGVKSYNYAELYTLSPENNKMRNRVHKYYDDLIGAYAQLGEPFYNEFRKNLAEVFRQLLTFPRKVAYSHHPKLTITGSIKGEDVSLLFNHRNTSSRSTTKVKYLHWLVFDQYAMHI